MAAPYLTPNQFFNITQGTYFTTPVSYSGIVNSWSAVGLPEGLSINQTTGIISGTPTGTTNRYGYIRATNNDGTSATIIKFIITVPQTQTLQFSISPSKGYADITEYQFTSNASVALSAYSLLWNFGDGSISSNSNPKHIYDLPGSYIVSLNAYTNTGIVTLSSKIDVKLLINESIYFDFVPPPTFAGHYSRYPFIINFTSSYEGPHYIDLAAQFSRSYESQNPQNKWSFLRPEWRFLDLSGNKITSIKTTDTVIYADELGKINHEGRGFVVGVTGTASFYFVDDIYNFDLALDNKPYTTLIATLKTSGVRSYIDSLNLDNTLPGYSNSLASATCPYVFFARQPDKLNITENGIRNYINPRWPSATQPLLVDTTFTKPYPDPWIDGNSVKYYEYPGSFCHYIPIETRFPTYVELGSPDIEVDIEPKSSINLKTGIKAYWKLDDDSGNVSLLDSTGNNNTLTNYNNVTLSAGKINGSAAFSGVYNGSTDNTSGNYLKSDTFSVEGLQNVSFSVWVKMNQINANQALIGQFTGFGPGGSWILQHFKNYGSGNKFGFIINNNKQIYSTTNPVIGQWYHIAATYDGSVIKLYINGILESSLQTSGPLINSGKKLILGWDNSVADYLNGELDEIGIWDRTLSEEEIYILYNNGQGLSYQLIIDFENKYPFEWIDETDYKTPGYFKGSFTTNVLSAFNATLTGNLVYSLPPLTGLFFNPILWLSNPEAGMMATAQYIYNNALSAVTTPNLSIAQVHNFSMPVITEPDFANNPMALSGFHGINSIAALPLPTYHAWVLDSEMNYMYRINTLGNILCAVDINKVVRDNNLGFYTTNQVSPVSIVLDSKQNIWMTLYDTQSALKFDSSGNFLLATTPLCATGYAFPPNIDPAWFDENTFYQTLKSKLFAFYNFDNTKNDSSGNGINLNGSYTPITGKINQGGQGTLYYNTDLWDIYASPQSYTASGWFKLVNDYSYSGGATLMGCAFNAMGMFIAVTNGNDWNNISSYYLNNFPNIDKTADPNGVYIYTLIPGGNYNNYCIIRSQTSLSMDTWYHVAVVHDSVAKTLSLYINGNLENTASYISLTNPMQYNTYKGFALAGSALGYGAEYGNDNEYDMVGLWNRTLTNAEIKLLYNNGMGLQYPFNNDLSINEIDLNFVEPTGIDTDSQDNVWVTYSNYTSGYLAKFNSNGGLLFSYAYPVCSCPQEIVVDNQDNVWVACSNNIWRTRECTLEKRDSFGKLLSSVYPIFGLNHLTLDYQQNPWFTFSYSWIGSINNVTGQIFTRNLSGTGATTYHSDWFDPAINTDETALEGIAVDLKGLVYVINSVENQVYVFDPKKNFVLNKFYINPQGFVFYQDDQYQPTLIESSLWGKSLQATGDWTGLRWCNKYGHLLPFYQTNNSSISLTGTSVPLNFIQHENYEIFKKNEDFDMAEHMKSMAYMPSLNQSTELFDKFFGSIFGKYPYKHYDLGVQTYEKISNFVANHSDIDSCNINQLYDMAASVDLDSEDFRLNYPPNVQRIIDIASINQSRLMGARSLDQTAFTKLNNQDEINRGNLITSLCYVVTAGTPLILKDRSINKYRIIPTGNLYGLSAYPLQALADSIGLKGNDWPSYYEFYEFIPSYDFRQLEGYIDWNNPQTTVLETLSTNNQWFSSQGFLEVQLSYELYKGLGLI